MRHDKSIEEISNHYIDLYSYAFSMLKNKADAEDVLQEAIASTLSRSLLNPYGYCVKVVKHKCVDLLRQKGTLCELSENMSDKGEDEKELEQVVKKLMGCLNDRERRLVELHDMDGLSMREIEQETKIG